MNTPMQPPYGTPDAAAPRNPDLAEQAVPGHGVPSQDPDPAAQVGSPTTKPSARPSLSMWAVERWQAWLRARPLARQLVGRLAFWWEARQAPSPGFSAARRQVKLPSQSPPPAWTVCRPRPRSAAQTTTDLCTRKY